MEKKKSDYFKKLGQKGGQATAKKYGAKHMRRIGKLGGQVTKNKYK